MRQYLIQDDIGRMMAVEAADRWDAQDAYIDFCEANDLMHGNLRIILVEA